MKQIHLKIQLLLLCLYLYPSLHAQVTIGIAEAPAKGALLQLKDIAGAKKGEVNAKKGLLIPRVSLVEYASLEPILSNASSNDSLLHTGLIVYNLTDTTHLEKGFAVWNGSEWNNIRYKETSGNAAGTEIKKILYTGTQANPANSVPFHSIEVNLKIGKRYTYYARPQFKLTRSYKPTSGTRDYEYFVTQYWQSSPTITGYSTDIMTKQLSNLDYTTFIESDMSPEERNEIWMYDYKSNEIFHIELFVMGESNTTATKIFAILIEQF
jgi:hypothetical protein